MFVFSKAKKVKARTRERPVNAVQQAYLFVLMEIK